MNKDLLRRTEWAGGQLLAFSGLDGPTDFEQGLAGRTAHTDIGVDLQLPGVCRLRFPECVSGPWLVTGDWFDLGQTRGAFLDAHHLLIEGPCTLVECQPEITTVQSGHRTLVAATGHLDAAKIDADLDVVIAERARWLARLELPPVLAPLSQQTLSKALSVMKTQVYTPEGEIRHRWTTPDRWPHRAMWLWDSVFHAIGWRHLDPALAREMLSAVLDEQRADGFVLGMMMPNRHAPIITRAPSAVPGSERTRPPILEKYTQPPVLSLGVKLVNDLAPDPGWIAELYPKLCAYVEWDLANRDRDGAGLVEWAGEGRPESRCEEGGMDNSPRFDASTQLDAVDFNALLALECEILAGFAHSLGQAEAAERWTARHHELCRLINQRLWSDGEQFYLDYDIEHGRPSEVMAVSGFLPLVCGAATSEQAAHLARHLQNAETFGAPLPVSSVARQTPAYAKDMWRGPVWVNYNWLIAYGLERYNLVREAETLRQKTMHEIERMYSRYGVLFEFFDDEQAVDPPQLLRKGKCAPEISPFHQVFHDYGWTATLYVDMALSKR